MKLSVIILNYNVRYFLEQCILSVQRAVKQIDSEIIVVDNASQDDSCEMVRERFPDVVLIANDKNVGFSKGNNIAVARASGAYVCILNPDTAVAEDVFVKALAKAESLESMGAMGVRLIDGTGSFLPESKRNIPNPKVSFSKLFGSGKKAKYYADHVLHDQSGAVDVLVGAFMLMKRDTYNKVAGFDEDYFMYGEDIDLSYKIRKGGLENWYSGNLSVLHYKGESTLRDRTYANRFYGAMRIFYKKHFSTNFLMDTLVSVGVWMARVFRKTGGVKRRNPYISKPRRALVVTDNLTLLQQLSSAVELSLETLSKSKLQDGLISDTLLIFDADYLPYAHIFEIMQQLKGRNNKFRIRPPGCNFLLGSDHNDQKGSIVVF